MKIITLIGIITLCQMLFFCNSKTERVQKQPEIYFNNQNFKYDDDELIIIGQENKKGKIQSDKKYKVNIEK